MADRRYVLNSEPTTLLPGTLDLLILRSLIAGEMHGLGISRRIQQITGGTFVVKPGSLFPALHRMEEVGWISSFWGESENNRRAKYYRFTKARSFLRNLFLSRRVEVDLDEEVHSHLEMLIAENIRAGMPPQEAQRAARIELGGIEQVKEQVREEGLGNWLHSVVSDCRYGLRQLRKNPGATAVMIFTLALAIGAATAIFSVVYGVLLRPLPYTDASRIMAVFEVSSEGHWVHLADPNFDDFRDQNRSFQAIAKYSAYEVSVSGASQPSRTTIAPVSPDFLKVFGIQPTLGRDFIASDAKKGANPTVLVSYGYWRQQLGSPRDLSQSHLKIGGAVFSVIGVLPAGFGFPSDVDLWLLADIGRRNPSRTSHNYYAVGRLGLGRTFRDRPETIVIHKCT